MSDRVTVEIAAGVADVRLNRPDKINALDPAMFQALVEAGEELARNATLRAAVLSGEGKGFCAGLDFASFQGLSETEAGAAADLFHRDERSPANQAQRAAYIWNELPVPVVAAVHGVAYGGGFQIAMGADIRFVAPDARLSVMEIKWGLIPDMSGTQTLRHLIPLDVAKELTFTGRIVSGREAGELGLATHVTENPREAAFELASEIATQSPDAIRAAKALLNGSREGDTEAGLRLEEELQKQLIGSPNQVEAVRANLERRAPDFRDPE